MLLNYSISLMFRMLLQLCFLPLVTGMRVLHLADFHLDVDYSTTGDNSQMCHNAAGGRQMNLGLYGDYMCDSPQV